MPSYVVPRSGVAFIGYVGLVDQGNTKTLKANPTLATGDVKVSIDGGAFNNLTTLPTVTPAGGTAVKMSLSAAEMTGDNISVLFSDAVGSEWCDLLVTIQTATRQVDDLAYPATSGRSLAVDASGQVTVGALAAAAIQSIWDALTSALTTVGSIGKRLADDIDATVSSRMATFTLPTNFSALVIDSTGRVNAFLIGILTSVFTEGATGRIAAAFKQFFNIASPAATMDHGVLVDTVTTATTATNLTNAPTAGDFTATMKTSLNAATPSVTVSDKTGYSLSSAGVQAIWDALTSALTTSGSIGKRIVDNLNATVSSRAVAGDAMTLTSGERTAIANEVEAQIIDETDSEKVLTAITDKIASVNPSLGSLTLAAIASQVRTELTTELARIDVAISTRSTYAGADTSGTTTLLSRLTSTRAALLDNLDAAVSSRLASGTVASDIASIITTLATIAGYIDTEVAAIKAKTDNLPSDPADASDVHADYVAVAAMLTTIAGYIDTEVAAIKAKTDNLPSDPADASDIAAALATISGYVDTEVAAIKAKTDNLPSDPASASSVSAQIAALLTTALTESYAAPGAAPTLTQAMLFVLQRLTAFVIDDVTISLKKLDGVTEAATLTLDSASAPTSTSRTT